MKKLKNIILSILWILIPIINGYMIATNSPIVLCFIFGSICGSEMYLEYKNLEES